MSREVERKYAKKFNSGWKKRRGKSLFSGFKLFSFGRRRRKKLFGFF